MSFRNKVVIITGANSGIGKATARLFAANGARIIAVDLADNIEKELGDELEEAQGDYFYFSCDVANRQKVKDLFDIILSTIGDFHVLINNAGILGPKIKTEDYKTKDFDRVIDVNVKGVFYFMKESITHFMNKGRGVIINTASLAGHFGMLGRIAYSASKHAVIGMTQTAAIEYAKNNIRINAICPGYIDTEMFRNSEEKPETIKNLKSLTPMKRFGLPGEVADGILFLASGQSSFMTGQSLIIDGGISAY